MSQAVEPSIFVGIDWATKAHEVCATDGSRTVLGRRSVPNTAAGLEGLVEWLLELAGGVPARLAVAIERPDGPVVEVLLAAEVPVYALNPKQLDRFRDRHCVAGAKDDRRDALVLADACRTDRHHFRRVLAAAADLVALRGLVRSDDDLRTEEGRLHNQFQEHLRRYYPHLLDLAADRPDPWLWDIWDLAPTPERARSASPEAVAEALARHRIRRWTAAEVMEVLRSPAVKVSDATVAAAVEAIGLLLPRIRLVHAQRRACGRRIDALLEALSTSKLEGQHTDAAILGSLPGVGRAVLARVLTEGAEAIRLRDLNRLRALGGSAPVTRRSGKALRVVMRRSCGAPLRFAFYHWGRTAMQRDRRSGEHYRELRRRGHSHGRAVRGVVDRLLATAMAMLRSGTLYDPARREGARREGGRPSAPGGRLEGAVPTNPELM